MPSRSTIRPGRLSPFAATPKAVGTAYLGRVLVPLVAGPLVGGLATWVVENLLHHDGAGAPFFTVSMLLAWAVACQGTFVLGQQFRDDRRGHEPNGARGWQLASIVLLALTIVPVVLEVLLTAVLPALGR